MKCPYCNKKLFPLVYNGGLACANDACKKSMGMVGTEPMWEKVASLVKIRNAGAKYSKAHKAEKAAYQRDWWRKNKGKQNAGN